MTTMTIEQVIELLLKNYKKATKAEYVKDPVAYALYYTWKAVEKL